MACSAHIWHRLCNDGLFILMLLQTYMLADFTEKINKKKQEKKSIKSAVIHPA